MADRSSVDEFRYPRGAAGASTNARGRAAAETDVVADVASKRSQRLRPAPEEPRSRNLHPRTAAAVELLPRSLQSENLLRGSCAAGGGLGRSSRGDGDR